MQVPEYATPPHKPALAAGLLRRAPARTITLTHVYTPPQGSQGPPASPPEPSDIHVWNNRKGERDKLCPVTSAPAPAKGCCANSSAAPSPSQAPPTMCQQAATHNTSTLRILVHLQAELSQQTNFLRKGGPLQTPTPYGCQPQLAAVEPQSNSSLHTHTCM
jgi:hypothetical protein